MKSIRIVFVGSVYFSKAMLESLLKKKVNIVGVCTKKKSSFNSDFYNLGKNSKKKRIRTLYTNNINSLNAYNWIKKRNPDLILCLGWSYLIKKKLLSLLTLTILTHLCVFTNHFIEQKLKLKKKLFLWELKYPKEKIKII